MWLVKKSFFRVHSFARYKIVSIEEAAYLMRADVRKYFILIYPS